MLPEEFEDELTCPVCLMLFTDPRTLPCGNSHNVCLECARGLWRNPATTGYGNSIQCPVCRATCSLGGGIDRLPLNLALKNMVEKLEHAQKNKGIGGKKAFPSKRKLKCDVCEKKPALMECVTCVVKYCEACLETCHPKDRAVFKAHVVVPMELVSTRECELHKGQALSFFCTQCGVAVCAHCLLMGAHIDHSRVSLQFAVKEKKSSLLEAIETLKANRAIVQDFSQRAERAMATMQYQCKEMRSSVGAECLELQMALQQLQRKLLDAIDAQERERQEALERQIDGQRQKLSVWSSMLERGEQIAQEEDGAVFLDIDTLKLERQIRAAVDAAAMPPPLVGGTAVNLTLNMAPLLEAVSGMHFTEHLVPSPPAALTCLEATPSSVLLTWRCEAKRDAPNTFIVEQSRIQEGAGCQWEEVYRGTSRAFNSTGLCPQASYRFRVCAVNASGRSEWSDETVFCTGPPCVPEEVILLETSDQSLVVAWAGEPSWRAQHCRYALEMLRDPDAPDAPAAQGPAAGPAAGGGGGGGAGGRGEEGNAGCDAPAGAGAGGGDGWLEVFNGCMRTCMVEGLLPGRAYSFRVCAINPVGRSPYSAVTKVRTLAATPSGGPVLSRPPPAPVAGAGVAGPVAGAGAGGGAADGGGGWAAADEEGNGVAEGAEDGSAYAYMAEQSMNAPADNDDSDAGGGENAVGNSSAVEEQQP